MRIGIDIDDTIFDTTEQYIKYQKKYLKENNISAEELWNSEEHRINYIKNNIELIFSSVNVKKDALSVMNKFISKGYKIYIISARTDRYYNDIYNFTENNLKEHNIPYHKLILTNNKLEECLKYNIDLMIDDAMYVYELLDGKIKTILFDDHNKYPNIKNRVSSWKEILETLCLEDE